MSLGSKFFKERFSDFLKESLALAQRFVLPEYAYYSPVFRPNKHSRENKPYIHPMEQVDHQAMQDLCQILHFQTEHLPLTVERSKDRNDPFGMRLYFLFTLVEKYGCTEAARFTIQTWLRTILANYSGVYWDELFLTLLPIAYSYDDRDIFREITSKLEQN